MHFQTIWKRITNRTFFFGTYRSSGIWGDAFEAKRSYYPFSNVSCLLFVQTIKMARTIDVESLCWIIMKSNQIFQKNVTITGVILPQFWWRRFTMFSTSQYGLNNSVKGSRKEHFYIIILENRQAGWNENLFKGVGIFRQSTWLEHIEKNVTKWTFLWMHLEIRQDLL